MKKIICEVDEDYLEELCEVFKKKPLGGIPTHRAWALLEGLKNGTPLDGLTNGEIMLEIFPNWEVLSDTEYSVYLNYGDNIVSFDRKWWNRKGGTHGTDKTN